MDDFRTLLRREESYAIHALIYAAENPGASASRMAADLQMPPAFLAKVLRKLSAAHFLESKAGRNGGVTLHVDAARLSLLDIVEAVSGAVVLDTCQTMARCPTQQRLGFCRLNVAWVTTSLAIRETLDRVHLSQLFDSRSAA
ncbi:MAG: Rrf2 family transcriptional regulator [Deinococcales bacterium]|jgi:Rrf2 family protein